MLLSAASVLIVVQPCWEIPEGLMNYPVHVQMFSTSLCLFVSGAGLSASGNLFSVNSGFCGQLGVVLCYVS